MGELLPSLSESYPAVPASLRRARRAVTALAIESGATPEQVDAVRLAASEALANVVVHAYGDRPGEIHLTAAVAGNELWLLVADDGDGLSGGGGKSGLGLGLTLIAQACEELTIVKRSGGGTELRMRFRVGGAVAVDDYERGSVSSARSPASSVFSTTR
ncbi:MAG TPA: ATP-binding protein [Solirubrobacteraceae bacterium]|jgi:anti-sigma regulatory factor (Ser/Thr protein kinase)|nr:ATP-binding protein [Solirubrobacteraceae bacterium]